jgi:hypothetical protein
MSDYADVVERPKKRKPGLRDHIKDACEAHCDLNLFASIIALLESGLNHAPTYRAAEQIIAICKREQTKCLNRLDHAMLKAGAPYPGNQTDIL